MVTAAFQATTSDDAIFAQWWIEIEGIRRRYGSHVPSWAAAIPDTLTNRPIRDWFTDLPEFRAQEAEPLDGSTKPHEFTVNILDHEDELTDLFSVHDDSCGIAFLTVALAAGGLAVTVDDASVFTFPCDIYINRETMRCTNIVGNVLTVARGMYDSEDVAHPITDSQGNAISVMVADKPRFMHTREVVLYECRHGLVEADAIAFRGYLDGIEEDRGVWDLHCSGFLRRLSCRIGETLAETKLVYPVWGGPDPNPNVNMYQWGDDSTWYMEVEDVSNFETDGHVIVDNEIIRYVSKCASSGHAAEFGPLLKMIGYDEAEVRDLRPYSSAGRGRFSQEIWGEAGLEEKELIDNHGDKYQFHFPVLMERHEVGAIVRQVIHSDDFGVPLSIDKIILELMTSTGTGLNGAYDVLPKGWGAGIPVAKIDVTEIVDICKLVPDVSFDPFCITEPTDLKEWLEENILRPCHLFFIENPDGKISVRRLWSKQEAQAWTTPTTVDHDVLLEIPEFTMGDPPIGEFTIKMNWNPGEDKFYGKIHVILGDGRERYKGTSRNYEIEIKTVYDSRISEGGQVWRSVDQGDAVEALRCYLTPIWENFALNPCPKISCEAPYNRLIDLHVGKVMRLTCSVTPDLKSSVRGMTSEWFQIIKAEPNAGRTSVELLAWMIGVHDDVGIRQLAPSAKVKTYVDPSPLGAPAVRLNLEDSEFTDGIAGYDYDVDGFNVGDEILMVDSQYRPIVGAVPEEGTIDAKGNGVGTCWIDLTVAPANPPGPGDFISTARYDSCVALQKSTWAYLADANAQLGAANDDAHKRER